MSASHAEDEGSIPSTRSKQRRAAIDAQKNNLPSDEKGLNPY